MKSELDKTLKDMGFALAIKSMRIESLPTDTGRGKIFWHCLTWEVELSRKGKAVYSGPYHKGLGLVRLPFDYRNGEGLSAQFVLKNASPSRPLPEKWERVLSFALTRNAQPLSLADVVASVVSDARTALRVTFEEWCDEYGYDTDSRKAFQTFTGCQLTLARLQSVCAPEEEAALFEMFADY